MWVILFSITWKIICQSSLLEVKWAWSSLSGKRVIWDTCNITNNPLDLTNPKTIHIWKLYWELFVTKTIQKSIDCTFCCCLRKYPFVCVCMNICICVYLCRSIEINKHSYIDIYNLNLNEIRPSECAIHLWEGILDMHKCHFQGHTESVTI